MKALAISLSVFSVLSGYASCEGALKFDIADPVTIRRADQFLDGDKSGGSVSVTLEDARGNLRFVHYMTEDAGPEFGGGYLSYRESQNGKSIKLVHGSKDEIRLLGILRNSCVNTFGTSDLEDLRNARGPKAKPGDGFSQMALASLLRHFPLFASSEK
jgi:hypothetical protein